MNEREREILERAKNPPAREDGVDDYRHGEGDRRGGDSVWNDHTPAYISESREAGLHAIEEYSRTSVLNAEAADRLEA